MPNNMIFSNPEFLWLIIVLLFLILIDYKFKSQKISNFNISSIKSFSKKSLKAKLYPFLNIIRYLAIMFLIVGLARPQIIDVSTQTKKSRGIDIVLQSTYRLVC